jgi:hypothetical protein
MWQLVARASCFIHFYLRHAASGLIKTKSMPPHKKLYERRID